MFYCLETRNRIMLSIYAYAYEFDNTSLVSDDVFDKLSLDINPKIKTNNKKLDKLFKKYFQPCTGMWIHKHPETEKIKNIYEKYFQNNAK